MSNPVPKKITDISLDDLLLVSDYNSGKCLSKRMTIRQLLDYIIQKIKVNQSMTTYVKDTAEEVFDDKIEDSVVRSIKDNSDLISDLLLDDEADGQMVIDSGGAGDLEPEEEQGE